MFYQIESPSKMNEPETKIRLIVPLFEILGWNFRDPPENLMEHSVSGWDVDVDNLLRAKYPSLKDKELGKTFQADCVLISGWRAKYCS
jgi:hypothetical protein